MSETILERERERLIEEETRRTTRLREPAHDAINHRPSRRISFTLGTRPIRGQFGFAEKGNDSRFDDESVFFFFLLNPSILARRAKPLLTKDWLSLIEPAPPTLFELSSFPFFVSLSLCESNRASR